MGMPVLQRARDETVRAIYRLDNVLVTFALRVRTIRVQQKVASLDQTVMVNQTST